MENLILRLEILIKLHLMLPFTSGILIVKYIYLLRINDSNIIIKSVNDT
jgi:hypothetical protein